MRLAALSDDIEFRDPVWYRFLFSNPLSAPVWLVVRTYVGWQWLMAGWHKIDGDGWVNNDGVALRSFWARIVEIPEQGRATIRYDWYRDFIEFLLENEWYTAFAYLIAFGEFFVGVALIVGAFTGLAAISGVFMNFNFMLAGTASTNPVLFLLGLLLLLAWKVSGRIGIDRWLLPALGTPWSSGVLLRQQPEDRAAG